MVSMTDIARELGVAASTVSRALQGHGSIPEATRERVRAAAERLGYRPDPVMTSLAARRWSRTKRGAGAILGFLLLGAKRRKGSEQLRGAHAAAEALGYGLEVFAIGDTAAERQTWRVLRARGMRGVVVRYEEPRARLPKWDWSSLAVVGCGEPPEDAVKVDTVELGITDNHQRLARELIKCGVRRPGMIFAGPEWMRSEHRRLGGLTTPFLEAGLGAPPFRWWNAEPVAEVREWLRAERVDAVVTMTAGQALRLREAGIVGRGGLPYLCMQVLPGEPGDIGGVLSNFYGVGEMAVRLCDMNIRQNRLGLPVEPVVVHIGSGWREGALSAP